jgi:hypothetical protein
MTWFEHLKYRWKFSRCKTNLEVLHVWMGYMMKDDPLTTMSDEEYTKVLDELKHGETKSWKKLIYTHYINIATKNGKHLM